MTINSAKERGYLPWSVGISNANIGSYQPTAHELLSAAVVVGRNTYIGTSASSSTNGTPPLRTQLFNYAQFHQHADTILNVNQRGLSSLILHVQPNRVGISSGTNLLISPEENTFETPRLCTIVASNASLQAADYASSSLVPIDGENSKQFVATVDSYTQIADFELESRFTSKVAAKAFASVDSSFTEVLCGGSVRVDGDSWTTSTSVTNDGRIVGISGVKIFDPRNFMQTYQQRYPKSEKYVQAAINYFLPLEVGGEFYWVDKMNDYSSSFGARKQWKLPNKPLPVTLSASVQSYGHSCFNFSVPLSSKIGFASGMHYNLGSGWSDLKFGLRYVDSIHKPRWKIQTKLDVDVGADINVTYSPTANFALSVCSSLPLPRRLSPSILPTVADGMRIGIGFHCFA